MDDWSYFSCPNRVCPEYGVKGKGNIRLKQKYGRNNVAELICRICGKTFSENRGTPFFKLRLPYEKLYQILTSLVRCGSIRGTADTVGVNKNTVERIVMLAGGNMKGFNDFMLARADSLLALSTPLSDNTGQDLCKGPSIGNTSSLSFERYKHGLHSPH